MLRADQNGTAQVSHPGGRMGWCAFDPPPLEPLCCVLRMLSNLVDHDRIAVVLRLFEQLLGFLHRGVDLPTTTTTTHLTVRAPHRPTATGQGLSPRPCTPHRYRSESLSPRPTQVQVRVPLPSSHTSTGQSPSPLVPHRYRSESLSPRPCTPHRYRSESLSLRPTQVQVRVPLPSSHTGTGQSPSPLVPAPISRHKCNL